MRFYNRTTTLVAALIFGISPSLAQQPQNTQANPLDNVPDKMPFNLPYGAPITAARAQAVIQAAEQEANRRGWPLNIAVVDFRRQPRRVLADGRRSARLHRYL